MMVTNISENTLYAKALTDYTLEDEPFTNIRSIPNIVALDIFNKTEAVDDVIEYLRYSINPE